MHEFLRKWIGSSSAETVAQQTRIIYGGSVNEQNAESLIIQKDIDGFLVGGASLKATFEDIVSIVNKAG